MKKAKAFIPAFILLICLCGCTYRDPVIASLPEYKISFLYTSGGFQDYTDYAEYYYDSVTAEDLEESEYLKAATAEDIDEILLYIEDFEDLVEAAGGELAENYGFDKALLSEGDFFCIKTRYGEPIGEGTYGRFDYYTVYYFDTDTQILYYFHNNI